MMKTENKRESQVHVGDTLEDMGRRFVDAWHRAERGELTQENAERHLGFETFETFSRAMTPRRLEMLRHVHRHGLEAFARSPSLSGGITGACTRMSKR